MPNKNDVQRQPATGSRCGWSVFGNPATRLSFNNLEVQADLTQQQTPQEQVCQQGSRNGHIDTFTGMIDPRLL